MGTHFYTKSLRCLVIAACVVISFTARAKNVSHCSAAEMSLWKCSSKQKVYELCASKNLSKSSGYLQYRAGRIGKIELSYPAGLLHPRGLFRLQHYARNGGLKFNIGRYEYELFDPLTGPGGSELRVFKDKSEFVSNIYCAESNEAMTNTGVIELFQAAGLDE